MELLRAEFCKALPKNDFEKFISLTHNRARKHSRQTRDRRNKPA
jgi:hypothetical protein